MEGSSLSYKWAVEPPPWLDIWQHLNGTFEPNYQSHHILSTRLLGAVFAAKQALLVLDAPLVIDWRWHIWRSGGGEWCRACKSPSVDIIRIDFHWELQRCIFWPEWKVSWHFFLFLYKTWSQSGVDGAQTGADHLVLMVSSWNYDLLFRYYLCRQVSGAWCSLSRLKRVNSRGTISSGRAGGNTPSSSPHNTLALLNIFFKSPTNITTQL